MRRALVFIAIGAALFVSATVAGFVWSARTAPDWVRSALERQLETALATPVRMGGLRLGVRGGIRLVARDVQLGPTAQGIVARADRVEGWLDPLTLVAGTVRLDRVVAEAPEIALPPGREGAEAPAPAAALAAALLDTPVRVVEIRAGRLVAAEPEGPRSLLLDQIEGSLTHRVLRPSARLELQGHLAGNAGRLRAEGHVRAGETDLALVLEGVALERLPARLRPPAAQGLQGLVSGRVAWSAASGEPPRIDLDLSGRRIAGRVALGGERRAFALARPALRAELRIEPARISFRSGRLSDAGVAIRFQGSVGRPIGDRAPLRLSLASENVPIASARELIGRLPLAGSEAAPGWTERLEAGRLSHADLQLHTRVGGLRTLARRGLLARPGELAFQLAFDGVRARVGESDRLESLSGVLRLRPGELDLEGLQAHYEGRPLPAVSGRIQGLENLGSPDELRCHPPTSGPALPGLGRLNAWLHSHPKEQPDPSWRRLLVEADWISHPALLCGAEQIEAEIAPVAEGGLDVELKHGVWAGVALRGRISLREDEHEHVDRVHFEAQLGSPFEPMALVPPTEPWGQGRFRWEAYRAGHWLAKGAQGRFRLQDAWLRIEDASLDLQPSGRVEGTLGVDLSDARRVRYETELRTRDADVTDFASAASIEDPWRLAGRLDGEARFQGELMLGRNPLAVATGHLSLRARKGRVARRLPILLALLMADPPVRPSGDPDWLPYDRFELEGDLADGLLSGERAILQGPTVRMVATGRVGVENGHPVEGVLGVLLFPGLDWLIDRLPVVNRLLLGANGNLFGAYYTVAGPWDDPSARLIPVKSLRAGPASFVLEDIPGFLWSGLKRIQGLLVPTPPPPRAAPSGRVDS